MYRLLLSLLLFACCGTISAQIRGDVPSDVITSFEQVYQQAENPRWSPRLGGGFIASFSWQGMPTEAHYDEYGEWMFTENFISREQLPQTAQIHLRRRYGQQEPSSIGHHNAFSGNYFFVRIGNVEWRYDREGNVIGQY